MNDRTRFIAAMASRIAANSEIRHGRSHEGIADDAVEIAYAILKKVKTLEEK